MHGIQQQELNGRLLIAAKEGKEEEVNILIKAGANVNTSDCIRNTPLHCAAESGHTKIVKALINAGASVNMVDCIGNTPLHCAAESGHTKIVKALINAGASVNMVDCIGNTPLHCAAESGHTEIVIDYLKRHYNGSYTLGKDELIIILNSIGELKEKEKCKKFKRLLEEMKEEEVKDTSLIELLMIKIHRNLGENEEAWNLYCSFDQESSFYSCAIEEAKQLVIEYQEDSILKGLSSLNVSSNGQEKDNKGVPNKHLPEEREALRRHKAESRFFDPKRNKKKLD